MGQCCFGGAADARSAEGESTAARIENVNARLTEHDIALMLDDVAIRAAIDTTNRESKQIGEAPACVRSRIQRMVLGLVFTALVRDWRQINERVDLTACQTHEDRAATYIHAIADMLTDQYMGSPLNDSSFPDMIERPLVHFMAQGLLGLSIRPTLMTPHPPPTG